MHRAFHENEFLWTYVHKFHHMYNVPNALTHYHFSARELLIQRIFKDWPLMVLLKLHFAEYLAYQFLLQILDVQIHCGYDHGYIWSGGWLGSRSDWHHYHHNQPGKGAYTLWCKWIDDFMGTSRNYGTWRERRLDGKGSHDEDKGVEEKMLRDDSGLVGAGGIYADEGREKDE